MAMTPTVVATGLEAQDRILSEIRAAKNAVENSISTRQAHPTYGYTKSMIRSKFDVLRGLVIAYGAVTGLGHNEYTIQDHIDFLDLTALATAVKNA